MHTLHSRLDFLFDICAASIILEFKVLISVDGFGPEVGPRRRRFHVMSQQPESSIHPRVVHEHRHLRLMLERSRELFTDRCESPVGMRHFFANLESSLRAHFAHEEADGIFCEVVAIAPRFRERVEWLKKEHITLLEQVKELQERVEEGPLVNRWWRETAVRFEAFVAFLLEHEASENDLIQNAYNQDIGAAD